MDKNKKIIISALILIFCAVLFFAKNNFFGNGSDENVQKINLKTSSEKQLSKSSTNNKSVDQKSILKSGIIKEDISHNSEEVKSEKVDLYSDVSSNSLPLSAITILSELPENIKHEVSQIYEVNNIYMVKKKGDKLIIITENTSNIRHGIEFTEISLVNGHKSNTILGYNGKVNDTTNEIWDYDKDTQKPIRHTVYDKSGDMKFVEEWNYSPDEQIKYEMKDSEGHVLSLRKEILDGGSDLRVEHLIYDKEGNTKINVTTTFDGSDIKRFTYYNADKPNESGSVFSEYTDGVKTKETVLTSDLKVKNVITSEYNDGNRESITVYDSQNNEIEKLSAE